MHALLALSASHLEKLAPSNLTEVARTHAGTAMAGLNATMSRVTPDAEAGDAAIAACYALMMQSWYMDDGLKSFLILSRSCSAVHGQVRESGVGAVFAQDDRMARVERMKKKFEGAPRFSETFLEHAIQSLEALRGLCEELFELDLIGRLEDCFRNLCNSPYQGPSYGISPPLQACTEQIQLTFTTLRSMR